MLTINTLKEDTLMDILELMQTTGALSGLVCLMMILYSLKKQLKQHAGK